MLEMGQAPAGDKKGLSRCSDMEPGHETGHWAGSRGGRCEEPQLPYVLPSICDIVIAKFTVQQQKLFLVCVFRFILY